MNPQLVKYAVDETAQDPRNFVSGELHELGHLTGKPYRPFTLNHGYFYLNDFRIIDSTGYVLDESDYQLTGLNMEVVNKFGMEACSLVVIQNPRVSSAVYVDARYVGGTYSDVSPTINELATILLNDTRSVRWRNIENMTGELNSNDHLMSLYNLFGYEVYRDSIDSVRMSLMSRSQAFFDALYSEYENQFGGVGSEYDAIANQFRAHIANKANPHRDNKGLVGLGSLINYAIASETEAKLPATNSPTTRYMTPLRSYQHIDATFGGSLRIHIDTRNPHFVTPTQAGTLSIRDINNLVATRLNATDTAASTYQLEGRSYAEIYSLVRSNLPASAVTRGRFSTARLGSGTPTRDHILTGSGWVRIDTLIDQYIDTPAKVMFVGYQGAPQAAYDVLTTTYGDIAQYPEGTVILYRTLFEAANYAGNGGVLTRYELLRAIMRTPSGWVGPVEVS